FLNYILQALKYAYHLQQLKLYPPNSTSYCTFKVSSCVNASEYRSAVKSARTKEGKTKIPIIIKSHLFTIQFLLNVAKVQ
ncbi:MAG: hypothetical protein KKB89_02595, partial [Candidatus Omnitrophica bacterium]|nr:hypothetical protein [Candidatus Omnitrophota bacterium]